MKYKIESIENKSVVDTWLISIVNVGHEFIGICVNNDGVLFKVDLFSIRLKTIQEYSL